MTYGLIVGLVLKGGTAQLGSLAANMALLGYSRKDEYDADKRGVHLMARAGYDPRGMTEFLQQLNAKDKDDPSRFETYFRTHPSTSDRIVRTQNEANAIRNGTVKP
jgi:predicted Zn-dependent protease